MREGERSHSPHGCDELYISRMILRLVSDEKT